LRYFGHFGQILPRFLNKSGFFIEKMPIFDAWKQGVDLADQLIDRRFKNLDSIWQDNLKIILLFN
jgi:hypothetical protein